MKQIGDFPQKRFINILRTNKQIVIKNNNYPLELLILTKTLQTVHLKQSYTNYLLRIVPKK